MSAHGTAAPVLRLRGVTKTYPGVRALNDASLDVFAGEVLGLVGGNGAGKSTLIGVTCGSIAADCGSIELAGQDLTGYGASKTRELGLSVVHQHPALMPELTVVENMLLGVPARGRPSFGEARAWTDQQLKQCGYSVDVDARVQDITVAQRHAVEIARALVGNPKVVMFDEPTEAFTRHEVEGFFEQIRRLTTHGVGVLYISHRLPEVFEICDRIISMRDGSMGPTAATSTLSESDVIGQIVGRSVEAIYPEKRPAEPSARPLLEVRDLQADSGARGSFTLRAGEIVGLAGVEGNGQREFLRALAGHDAVAGEILVDGEIVPTSTPVKAARSGIALVPQDRVTEGLAMQMSVRENLTLGSLSRITGTALISRRAESRVVGESVATLGIKTPSGDATISQLSGGNQQKVLIGRTLLADPRVLLFDEPTQGVDVGVRADIYRLLREQADAGKAVIVLSSNSSELVGVCDTVLVFSRGHVAKTLTAKTLDETNIAEAAHTADIVTSEVDEGRDDRAPSRSGLLKQFLAGDYAPSGLLAVAIVLMGFIATSQNPLFLSTFSIRNILLLVAPLLFIAAAQQVVMLTGGIDISVGPLAGLLVVIASFYLIDGQRIAVWLTGLALMVATACAIGLTNGVLVRYGMVLPIVATLVTNVALQGFSLTLRPTPGGAIASDITAVLTYPIGFMPVSVICGVFFMIGLERWLRRSRRGMSVRAVGSSESAAHRIGIRITPTHMLAYLLSSLFTLLGALCFMAQTGVGDATAGMSLTFASITAVVLGGASVFGGRGSFIGAMLGAIFLQVLQNAAVFMGLSTAWQYALLGCLALAATALYARARRADSAYL